MFPIPTIRSVVTDSAFSETVSTDAAEPEKEVVVDDTPETEEAPADTIAAVPVAEVADTPAVEAEPPTV